MRISPDQRRILRAMREGATLKAHRTLDGEKTHRLHPLVGEPETVASADVVFLRDAGLIRSNMKFPAATYILTERGVDLPL
ncbi:MAG: hypothetical protein BWY52_00025 [Chloroflexi bacterium ADurb.Bin325]|nr:MAG: hypothetical protein BWY52_00025 [Chloroflexi bacterium ADurb.Bin325]